MRLKSVAGVVVVGGLMAGCQSAPKEQATTSTPTNESTVAALEKTYRASHPGSEVGIVNAIDPPRRILSVEGIPSERIRPGVIMTIMIPGGGSVQAVVYATAAGYVQLRYEPLPAGQSPPNVGDMAVWNPGGPAVIPAAIPPSVQTPTAAPPQSAVPPFATPTEPAMPATRPMVNVEPASRPAEREIPAATLPGVEAPTTTTATPIAPPPTVPQSRPVPDINK